MARGSFKSTRYGRYLYGLGVQRGDCGSAVLAKSKEGGLDFVGLLVSLWKGEESEFVDIYPTDALWANNSGDSCHESAVLCYRRYVGASINMNECGVQC